MKEQQRIELLPAGWSIENLGDIGIVSGEGIIPSQFPEEIFELWSVPNFDLNKPEYTKGKEIGSNKCLVREGDVLLCKINPRINRVWKVGKKAKYRQIASTEWIIVRNQTIIPEFLVYQLSSQRIRNEILKDVSGVGGSLMRARPNAIRSLKIALPPNSDQRRIVSKAEELFSEMDKGVEQLKMAQLQLKTYRQAVLKWAFEGRYTNKNVKKGELPNGWTWCKSGDLFDYVTSGSRGWAKYYSAKGAIFLRITNLDFDTLDLDLCSDKIQYVQPPANSEGIRTKIQEGDFLFSITGYLGMFAIAPKLDNAFVNQHIALCRPKTGFNKRFVGYWIISKSGGHYYLNKMTKGATKAGLGLDDIKNFPVPFPPIEEQNEIVQEIEIRLTRAIRLEEDIGQSLQQTYALRQSILKAAFEGRLGS